MTIHPFHLAFPIRDIEEAKKFYTEIIGCEVGRESDKWIDFNFYGHQISAHLKPEECAAAQTNHVDGEEVPVRHFGLVLEWSNWENLAENIKSKNVNFLIKPQTRFKGAVGEQGTFFIKDPSGNALEFKTFRDIGNLFKAA